MLRRSSSAPSLLSLPDSPLFFKRTHSFTQVSAISDPSLTAPLQSAPSFSIYTSSDPPRQKQNDQIQETKESKDFTFGRGNGGTAVPLFLARGLGIDRIGSGLLNAGDTARKKGISPVQTGNGELEMEHRRKVEDDPSNALALRDYAEFLYKEKGDCQRAEEYYSRAVLAEPSNGEILSEYAKLVWEIHRDMELSLTYFEKAVRASPQNSYVLAAYARFLWEIDDGDEDEEIHQLGDFPLLSVQHEQLAAASI